MINPSFNQQNLCINVLRGLIIDGVEAANSGHPGLPLGTAPLAFILWTKHLNHSPRNPKWFNRDRFILSAGHGSMLLYALLHLTGYELSLEELKQFRKWNSKTPGHPENTLTPGIEMATGPLGQGFATAIGMAIAERFLGTQFNKPNFPIIDHYTYVLCSDGDLMEGISQEASSLAGHLQLNKLIVLYDDNCITIDGTTELTYTENVTLKFESLGWNVLETDGNNLNKIDEAITKAKSQLKKPTLIRCKTTIGFGSPNKAGTSKAHGAPLGKEETQLTKKNLGLPLNEEFWIPNEVKEFFNQQLLKFTKIEEDWNNLLEKYKETFPSEAQNLISLIGNDLGDQWLHALPKFEEAIATRNASHQILNSISSHLPTLIGGSADLAESVLTHLKNEEIFQPHTPNGRNIAFGVREHAMAAAVNGITLHGGCQAFGGTFLIFSDYCRPAVRLAALMECPSIFLFSHDSIGLGEDGPTHQPIEHIMSLRAVPNLQVFRPADGNETSVCWKLALQSQKSPSVILLSRQKLPILTPLFSNEHPSHKGAYILKNASNSKPNIVIVATGSEVQLATTAAEILEKENLSIQIVSMPCWELFEKQSLEYKQEILPPDILTLSIEAGTTLGWAKYAHAHIGIDHFGASGPGTTVLEQFGFNTENVIEKARQLYHEYRK